MEDNDFWNRLEARINSEILGLKHQDFHGRWCDGFVPERLGLVGDRQAVIGTIWMSHDKDRSSWHFALLLMHIVQSIDQIDWEELLPSADVTGWLSLNLKKKEMKIDPAAAYSDLTAESET